MMSSYRFSWTTKTLIKRTTERPESINIRDRVNAVRQVPMPRAATRSHRGESTIFDRLVWTLEQELTTPFSCPLARSVLICLGDMHFSLFRVGRQHSHEQFCQHNQWCTLIPLQGRYTVTYIYSNPLVFKKYFINLTCENFMSIRVIALRKRTKTATCFYVL